MAHCAGFELLNDMLKKPIMALRPEQGWLESPIPGLALTRFDHPTSPAKCLHYPMVAYIAQGFKRSFYGEQETRYGTGQCVVLGVYVPGIFQIGDASNDNPFLSLSVRMYSSIITRLLGEMPELSERLATPKPLGGRG